MTKRYSSFPRVCARTAFSLVELVLVVAILGIIAAIAIPRMTNAVSTASAEALHATLNNVRKAIDVYYAEHNLYPGYDPATTSPDGTYFVTQLTQYTDASGRPNPTYAPPYIYGPYLRTPFPRNPFNGLSAVHVKAKVSFPNPADGTVGWVADLDEGTFGISATDYDFASIRVDILQVGNQKKFRSD
ncbi:MAG: prepilin-type N-terminal cleavage/methylation domain-containing protein [Planctomycetota bacterium]